MLKVPYIDLFLKHITQYSLHCAKIAFVFPSHSFSKPKKFVAICNRKIKGFLLVTICDSVSHVRQN